jgi:putative peptidoglycan lipid II flippase
VIRPLLARLRGPARGSVHNRILSAAAIVASFTFGAKIAGAAKEIIVAKQFGTSREVDAYLVAAIVPTFVVAIISTALSYALMPAYVAVREREGQAAAQRLLSTVMAMSLAVLLGAAILAAALTPLLLPLLAERFSGSDGPLTRELTYVLLPMIVLYGITTTWSAVLNAHRRFASPAAAGLAVPLVTVGVLVLCGRFFGIHALAWGTVAGCLAETILVGVAVRREGLSLVPRWGEMTPGVRQVLGQSGPAAAAMLFTAANPLVDQVIAATLGPGSVAALGYGNKVVAFVAGIGSLSLGAAVRPHFSQLAAAGDWVSFERTIWGYNRIVVVMSVVVTASLIALSTPIVRVLFEHGAFTARDSIEVGRIQAYYALQIPFRMMSLLFVGFMISTAHNRAIMAISLVNLIVNVVGDVVLARYLGVAGIALTTSVVCAVSCLMNVAYATRRIRAYLHPPAALEAV